MFAGHYGASLALKKADNKISLGYLFLMRSTSGKTFMGKYGMYIFAIFLLLMNALTYWGPRVQSAQVIAIFNETFYLVTAAITVWLDRKRSRKGQVHPVLERRSRNGKDGVDRESQIWLAQEKRTRKAGRRCNPHLGNHQSNFPSKKSKS